MSKFSKLSSSIEKKEGVSKEKADAITASIGRKKYGAKQFQQMATNGRKKGK